MNISGTDSRNCLECILHWVSNRLLWREYTSRLIFQKKFVYLIDMFYRMRFNEILIINFTMTLVLDLIFFKQEHVFRIFEC